MRVLVAGGGTGGHVYIGVSLARELVRRDPASQVLFVGTRRGLESRIVPQEGFRLVFIESTGLKRVGALRLVQGVLLLPRSIVQSLAVVRRFAPDVAVGVGGFASGPAMLAAWMLRCPTLVVEPNAYPGFANRVLAPLVDRAAVALDEAAAHFGGKAAVTGIPVRREFHDVPRRTPAGGSLTLLAYGGSQGSHALNRALCEAAPELAGFGPALRLIHQTGDAELETVRKVYRQAGLAAEVAPFLPRIYDELARADLVLARAGAGTVAELTVAGRASLLVPLPTAADDHQSRNAEALARAGAARVLPQRELDTGRLVSELRFFLEHPDELQRMCEAAKRMAKPDAAERIADLVVELARRR